MFCRGYFTRVVRPSGFRVVDGWLEGNSSVPEQVGRNGTEERPEWDASPEKPSKPLRFDTESKVLSLGMRAEHLAGISGFAVDLSALCVLSRGRLRALRERWT